MIIKRLKKSPVWLRERVKGVQKLETQDDHGVTMPLPHRWPYRSVSDIHQLDLTKVRPERRHLGIIARVELFRESHKSLNQQLHLRNKLLENVISGPPWVVACTHGLQMAEMGRPFVVTNGKQ